MTVRVRFAPSPTGFLHVGNARMAVINALAAKHLGGEFWLRLDDTDKARSTQEYADAIRQDLDWLGLARDNEAKQSERLDAYEAAFEKLKAQGRVYACYETPEELDYLRKRLRALGKPPIYTPPSDEKLKGYMDEGRPAHWRFKLEPGVIEFTDLVRGPVSFDPANLSDPVIRRNDGSWLYMLPSAVDDADMEMTHVVRGEDHVANTALQVQMFEAMGAAVPTFAHFPLLTSLDGSGLSKRLGSLSLQDLRADGVQPLALLSYLARIGSSQDMTLAGSVDELVESFTFEAYSRATPKFDPAQLWRMNAQLLHDMDYASVKDLLVDGCDEALWLAVRANVEKPADAAQWVDVAYGDITPVIEDADFIAKAAELLPEGDFNEDTWGAWTSAVKDATGAKGKALFMPLRKALTGLEHGPELKAMLPLIGRDKALARMRG